MEKKRKTRFCWIIASDYDTGETRPARTTRVIAKRVGATKTFDSYKDCIASLNQPPTK